jgi:Ca-activated chloride channel family protein
MELLMDMPTILFSPLKAGVPASGGTLDMLVRVQAPDRPANTQAQMPSKRLALVVDRSGSMSGQPLYEALRCVEYIASHLTHEDALSLVVYDNKVQVLLPLQPMREIENIHDALDRVEAPPTCMRAGLPVRSNSMAAPCQRSRGYFFSQMVKPTVD